MAPGLFSCLRRPAALPLLDCFSPRRGPGKPHLLEPSPGWTGRCAGRVVRPCSENSGKPPVRSTAAPTPEVADTVPPQETRVAGPGGSDTGCASSVSRAGRITPDGRGARRRHHRGKTRRRPRGGRPRGRGVAEQSRVAGQALPGGKRGKWGDGTQRPPPGLAQVRGEALPRKPPYRMKRARNHTWRSGPSCYCPGGICEAGALARAKAPTRPASRVAPQPKRSRL